MDRPSTIGGQRSGMRSWLRIGIADVLELVFCLAFLLSITRLYHWIPAGIVGCGAFLCFVLVGRTQPLGLKPKWLISVPFALALWSTCLFEWVLFELDDPWDRLLGRINFFLLPFLLAIVPLVTTAILLGTRAYGSLALYILLSPMFVGACRGAIDYVQGDAVLPGRLRVFQEVDRVTRLKRLPQHEIRATAWYQEIAYEDMLIVLTRLFGPMRGTYAGPYPSEAEARTALMRGQMFSDNEILESRTRVLNGGFVQHLTVDGETIRLKGLAGPGDLIVKAGHTRPKVVITTWQNECVVVGIIWAGHEEIGPVYLFSRATGERFAVYGVH